MAITIQPLLPEHWPVVRAIYEQGIATGDATFQTSAPEWEEWDRSHLPHSRFIAVENDSDQGAAHSKDVLSKNVPVIGWVALTPVSSRCVYAGVAEISVYVDPNYRGKGVGNALMQAVITDSETHGIWTLQAGIFPENVASIRLHEKVGFRVVGVREKIGKMKGRWRDTVFLEKRSDRVGRE